MLFHRSALFLACLTAATVAIGGCDGGGTATLEVLITDAPSDYIASAEIWVSHAYLQGGEAESEVGAEAGARVELFNEPENPRQYDLLQLQNGITAVLTGPVSIPEGPYAQLRLVIDSAFVTLKPEYQFQGGGQTAALMVPSGSSSGIKVQLAGPVAAADGTTTTLTVDVPVDENFVIQGNPDDPDGIQGMSFTPLLRELVREES